jgi:hypothetical protein
MYTQRQWTHRSQRKSLETHPANLETSNYKAEAPDNVHTTTEGHTNFRKTKTYKRAVQIRVKEARRLTRTNRASQGRAVQHQKIYVPTYDG